MDDSAAQAALGLAVGNQGDLPNAYLASSPGQATASGHTINLPACVAVVNGQAKQVPASSVTASTPSRTLGTITAGSLSITQNPQQLALWKYHIVNSSGGSVSGTINAAGQDERGYDASDAITVASLGNGSSIDYISNHYMATIEASNSLTTTGVTGTLGNSGVTITITEYQLRGWCAVSSAGFVLNTTCLYTAGQIPICQYESNATQAFNLVDLRALSPLLPGQRVGSEIVDWSGGTQYGPQNWQGNCIYALAEGLDGHVFIAGNGGQIAEWDGNQFGSMFTLAGNTSNINTIANFGYNLNGQEILYFGCANGTVIRWNRTLNTTQTASFGATVQQIVKTFGNHLMVVGAYGTVGVITDNGTSQFSLNSGYGGSTSGFPTGDTIFASIWHDQFGYLFGGGGTKMRFARMNFNAIANPNGGQDLTNYLPGTSAARGATSGYAGNQIQAAAINPNGLIMMAGYSNGGGLYLAEWNTRQQYATGQITFTTNAAATIPAGTICGNGTISFVTTETVVLNTAGSVQAHAIASTPGQAGFAASGTVTTLISSISAVTAVSNPEPFGMGRWIADGYSSSAPYQQVGAAAQVNNTPVSTTSIPLAIGWSGTEWVITMQDGSVLTYDGQQLMTSNLQGTFKGRATCVLKSKRCTWTGGDEGRLFSRPH